MPLAHYHTHPHPPSANNCRQTLALTYLSHSLSIWMARRTNLTRSKWIGIKSIPSTFNHGIHWIVSTDLYILGPEKSSSPLPPRLNFHFLFSTTYKVDAPHVIIIISSESGIELPLKGNPRELDTQSGKVSTRYVHSEENSEGLGEKVKPIILRRLIPFLFSHHKAHQHQQHQQWSRRAKVRRSRGHTVPEGQQPVMATRVRTT